MVNSYVFPKSVAKAMASIDQKTQYEATMLSMLFMMIGLAISMVYLLSYTDFKVWFKLVTVINGFFGLLFMSSALITAFQQYQAYMQFKELQDGFAATQPKVFGVANSLLDSSNLQSQKEVHP